MRRRVRHPAAALARRPRRPDLDLRRRTPCRQRAEVVRTRPGDRAARLPVRQTARLQRTGQPRPAHLRQQRVGGHLRLQFGAHQGHQPEVALPGLVPGGVVEQDEPPVREIVLAVDDRRLQRVRVRSQAFRWPRRLHLQLGPQPRRAQRVHRRTERGRDGNTLRTVRAVSTIGLIGEVSLRRSHAGKRRRNRSLARERTPVRGRAPSARVRRFCA